MKHSFRVAVLVGVALVVALAAKALMVAPSPLPVRVLNSDVVVVGKVTSVEEKTTVSKKDGVEYKVAVIKIEQDIKGAKDTTHIRVAWPAPQVQPPQPVPLPGQPIQPIFPRRPRFGGMNLQKDQEALLFLKKHPTEPFYVGAEFMSVVIKDNNANFKNELAEAVKGAKVLGDPMAALKSKDAEERLLAAGLQLQKHRMNRTGTQKQEPISAEESKLILKTIAELDWNPNQPNRNPGWYMMNPRQMFYQLQLTAADGWVQPKPNPKMPQNFQKEFEAAAKKWLSENAEKYVIKRYVDDKAQDQDR